MSAVPEHTDAGDTRYRVEELAETARTSVDTIRYYQHRGLLPPPTREGRVAFYDEAHLARLNEVKELKDRGLSLATIARLVDGGSLHPVDAALVSAVAASGETGLTLEEVAERSGVPADLLRRLADEGLFLPADADSPRPYGPGDVQAVRSGLALMEAGVPIDKLLELGRSYQAAVDDVAEQAVALFDEYVRRPTRSGEGEEDPDAASEHVLEAFQQLLPAASSLVRLTFERALLRAARERIDEAARDGSAPSA